MELMLSCTTLFSTTDAVLRKATSVHVLKVEDM